MGRRSSQVQRERLGEEAYRREMARRGRLGGRPRKDAKPPHIGRSNAR